MISFSISLSWCKFHTVLIQDQADYTKVKVDAPFKRRHYCSTGNFYFNSWDHVKMNIAFVANSGHFDNEFDSTGPEGLERVKVENFKPQVDRFVFPDGHCSITSRTRGCPSLIC